MFAAEIRKKRNVEDLLAGRGIDISRSDRGYFTYIITTRRITSGELLKYRNGSLMARCYHGQTTREFGLTAPSEPHTRSADAALRRPVGEIRAVASNSKFLTFSHCRLFPLEYRLPARFETIPSRPASAIWLQRVTRPPSLRAMIQYARAATEFFDWFEANTQLAAIESVHVATYIEQLSRARSAPTAKLRLAALRHLFDWMVIGQIMPTNPAAAARGPRHIVRRGKTPVLDPAEAHQLIDAIDTTTVIGLRDRALIGLMVYSFARRCGDRDARRGRVFAEPSPMGAPAREGRQALPDATSTSSQRFSFLILV